MRKHRPNRVDGRDKHGHDEKVGSDRDDETFPPRSPPAPPN